MPKKTKSVKPDKLALFLSAIVISIFSFLTINSASRAEGNDSYTTLLLHMDGSDDGTTFTDDSEGASEIHTVTPTNAVTKTGTKKFGTASAHFDGSGDYLTIPDSDDWNIGGGDFTIDFWMNAAEFPTNPDQDFILNQLEFGGGGEVYGFAIGTVSNTVGAYFSNTDMNLGPQITLNGSVLGRENTWVHVAIVRNGDDWTLYIDGIAAATLNNSLALNNFAGDLVLGGVPTYGAYYYNGYVDEMRITKGLARWTDNFTPPTAPYDDQAPVLTGNDAYTKLLIHSDTTDGSTTFTSDSSSPRQITANGNAHHETDAQKFGASSIFFDGSGDYLSMSDSPDWTIGADDFTVDFWLKRSAISGQMEVFAGQMNASVDLSSTPFILGIGNDNRVLFAIYSGNTGYSITSTGTIADTNWHHIAGVRDGNTLRLFIDGAAEGTANVTGVTANDASSQFSIGRIGELDTAYFAGYIDEFRFSKGVARWTSGFTTPTAIYGPAVDQNYVWGGVPYSAADDYTQENLQGACTKFVVDTANSSGHFTNASGTAQTLGADNDCSKVFTNSYFRIGSTLYKIENIIGEGDANDNVEFIGTLATGTYDVSQIYATEVSGTLALIAGECRGELTMSTLASTDSFNWHAGTANNSLAKVGDTHFLNTYRDSYESKAMAVLLTVDKVTETITAGTPVEIGSGNWGRHLAIQVDSSHVLDLYEGATNQGVVIEVNTSTGTITPGTAVELASSLGGVAQIDATHFLMTNGSSATILEVNTATNTVTAGDATSGPGGELGRSLTRIDSNHFLSLNGNQITVIEVDPINYTVTLETSVGYNTLFNTGRYTEKAVANIDSSHVLEVYQGDGNSNGYAVILEIDTGVQPSVISAGTPIEFVNNDGANSSEVIKIDANRFLNVWGGDHNEVWGVILKVDTDTNSITAGDPFRIGYSTRHDNAVVRVDSELAIVSHIDGTDAEGDISTLVKINNPCASIFDNVTSTTITNANSQINTSEWSAIDSAVASDSSGNGSIWYSVSFDNRNEFKIWTGSAWRIIASNNNSTHGLTNGKWAFRDNGDGWVLAETSGTDTANSAISQAMAQSNNRMTGASLEAISGANWSASGGFDPSQSTLDLATTLYGNNGSSHPSVNSVDFLAVLASSTEVVVVDNIADYSALADTDITLNIGIGTARLLDDAHTVVLGSTQSLKFSNAQADTSAGTSVGGRTVSSALASLQGSSVSNIKHVELRVGSGVTGNIKLRSGSMIVEIPDQTTVYAPSTCTQGKLTPPVDLTGSLNVTGWTINSAVSIGNDGTCKGVVLNHPSKVTLPTVAGSNYYQKYDGSWIKINACTDATTESAGSLAFPNECYLKDGSNTIIWTYHFTTFGNMSSVTRYTAESYVPGGATGWAQFQFTPASNIPADGTIMFMIPDEFGMVADGDLIGDLTTFTVEGDDATDRIATATLTVATGNIIKITLDTEIAGGEEIIVRFDDSVFTTNPVEPGQYAIALSTLDENGATIEFGYVMTDISNYVDLSLSVQEALILTLDSTVVNLNVDPAVNNGKDFSQKTLLQGKTNAQDGYVIQAKLEDSKDGSTAALYNSDTNTFITSGNALSTPNRLGYVAYNADVSKTQTELESEASSGASTFSNTDTNLVPYTGVPGEYLETTGVTNSQYHTIYYALYVDFLTTAGTYTGTVTYTAVPSF